MNRELVEKLKKIIMDDSTLSSAEKNAKIKSLDVLLGFNPKVDEDEEFIELLSDSRDFINDDSMSVADFIMQQYNFDKNVTQEEVSDYFDSRVEGILSFINNSKDEEMTQRYQTILSDTFADWRAVDYQFVNGHENIDSNKPTIQQERLEAKQELNNFINQIYGIEPKEIKTKEVKETTVEETKEEDNYPTYEEVYSAPEVKPVETVTVPTSDTPSWDSRLTEEQILDAYARDIFEPVGQEYEMFLREHGLDPIKQEVKAKPEWDPRLTEEQILDAYSRDIYEPVGPEYEMFLSDLGLSKPRVAEVVSTPVKEEEVKVEEETIVNNENNKVLTGNDQFNQFLSNMNERVEEEKVEEPIVEENKPQEVVKPTNTNTFASKVKVIKDHIKSYVNGIILGIETLKDLYSKAVNNELGLTPEENNDFANFYKDRYDAIYDLNNKFFKVEVPTLTVKEPVEEKTREKVYTPFSEPRKTENIVENKQPVATELPEVVHVPLKEEYEEEPKDDGKTIIFEPTSGPLDSSVTGGLKDATGNAYENSEEAEADLLRRKENEEVKNRILEELDSKANQDFATITEDEIKERIGNEVSSSTDVEGSYENEEKQEDLDDDFIDLENMVADRVDDNPDEPILTSEQLDKMNLYGDQGEIESTAEEKVVQNREEQYAKAFEATPEEEPTEKSAVDVLFEVKEELAKEKENELVPEEIASIGTVDDIKENELSTEEEIETPKAKESNNIHEITNDIKTDDTFFDYLNSDKIYESEDEEVSDITKWIDGTLLGEHKVEAQPTVQEEFEPYEEKEEVSEETIDNNIEEGTEDDLSFLDKPEEEQEEVDNYDLDENLDYDDYEVEDTVEEEKTTEEPVVNQPTVTAAPQDKQQTRFSSIWNDPDEQALRDMVKVKARRIPPLEKIIPATLGAALAIFGLATVKDPVTVGNVMVPGAYAALGGAAVMGASAAASWKDVFRAVQKHNIKKIAHSFGVNVFFGKNGKIRMLNFDGSELSESRKENIQGDIDKYVNQYIDEPDYVPSVTADNLQHAFNVDNPDVGTFYVTGREAKEYKKIFGDEPAEEDEYYSFSDIHGDSVENHKTSSLDESIMDFINILRNGDESIGVDPIELTEGVQIRHDHNDGEAGTYLALNDDEIEIIQGILNKPAFIEKYGKYDYVTGYGIYTSEGYPLWINVQKRDLTIEDNAKQEQIEQQEPSEREVISAFKR